MKLRLFFYFFIFICCICRYNIVSTNISQELVIAIDFHEKNQFEKAKYFYLKHLANNANCEFALRNLSTIGFHVENEIQPPPSQLQEIQPITTSIWSLYKLLSIYPNAPEIKNLLLKCFSSHLQENIFLPMPNLLHAILTRNQDVLHIFLFFLSLVCMNIAMKKTFHVSILSHKLNVYILGFLGILNVFLFSKIPYSQEILFTKKDGTITFSSLSDTTISKTNEYPMKAGTPLLNIQTIGGWKRFSLPSGDYRYISENSVISSQKNHPMPREIPQ